MDDDPPVLTTMSTDTKDTAAAVNAALGLSGDAALTPEVLATILQTHAQTATDIREQQAAAASVVDAEERAAASNARDARHRQRQVDDESQREADEMNGESRNKNHQKPQPHSARRGRERCRSAGRHYRDG